MTAQAAAPFLYKHMSALDKALGIFGLARNKSHSEGLQLSDSFVGQFGIFSQSSKKVPSKKAMEQYKGWVYTALRPVAEDVAKIHLRLKRLRSDQTEEELQDHDLINLISAVNPHMTKFELFFLTTIHIGLTGNAYWMLDGVEAATDKPKGIYPLNPKFITVKKSGLPAFIEGYEYRAGTDKRTFEPYQILHFRDPDPNDPYEGIGVVQSIPEWVDAENLASAYNRAFFENAARPDAVLEAEHGYTETQMNVVRRSFEDRYRGVDKAHKTLMLPKGVTFKDIQRSQKEMDFVESQRENRDKILAAFGVPRTRIGLTDDVNRANAEATIFAFAEHTVKPKMELITTYLNEFLVPRFGDDLFFDFDSPVPADREADREDRKAALAGQPYKSINEVREEEGDTPIEGGDTVRGNTVQFQPIGEPVPENKAVNEGRNKKKDSGRKPATRGARASKKRNSLIKELGDRAAALIKDKEIDAHISLKEHGITALTDEQYDQIHKQFVTRVTEREERIRKEFINMHSKQQQEVIANLREIEKDIDPNDLFNKGEWTEVILTFATPVMLDMFEEEGAAAAELLGVTGVNILTEETREAIEEDVLRFAEKYNDTTADALAQAITKGQQEGLSLPELEKEVAAFYEFSDQTRAQRVARTETFRVANKANKEAWKKTGVVKTIKWFTAADERVESFCRALHGKVIDIEENFFNIGDTVEGEDGKTLTVDFADVEAPPLHVNCRCTTRPENVEV